MGRWMDGWMLEIRAMKFKRTVEAKLKKHEHTLQ